MGDDNNNAREGGLSEFELLEAVRAEAAYRRLLVRLGDINADLAWLLVHKVGIRTADKACARLMVSCELYQRAGLTRRARSAWRYARLIHRAKGRAAA